MPDVIFSYTRAQAIADGVLVALPTDIQTPFKYPVCITRDLWTEITRGKGATASTRNARIWDVCFMATMAAKLSHDGMSDVFYQCRVGARRLSLWANCGPDDEGKPCLTIGFPSWR